MNLLAVGGKTLETCTGPAVQYLGGMFTLHRCLFLQITV